VCRKAGGGSETWTEARCREETSMSSSTPEEGAGAGVCGRLALEADAPEEGAEE
jgi:hypothetical protein